MDKVFRFPYLINYKVYSLKWQNLKKSQSSMANFGVF